MKNPLFISIDQKFMQKALRLAKSVKGKTGNNPAVGAVIYKNDRLLGRGATQKPGQDHAEKRALKDAGKAAVGATMAVTLEPCCFTGRTGPCTQSIIDARIKRVVVACKDPNPKVNGKGIRALMKAGLRVDTGLLADKAKAINRDFFKWIGSGLPWVSIKAATTINGLIAASSGKSKWISSEASRKMVHTMRARHDAILVGLGTVLKDNPSLNVRHTRGQNPVRIVLADTGRLNPKLKVVQTADKQRTIVLTSARTPQKTETPIEYYRIPSANGKMNIRAVLKKLGKLGIKSVLVEGGSRVFTDFVEQNSVDRYHIFLAGKLLTNGIPIISGKKTLALKQARQLNFQSIKKLGNDLLITAEPVKG